MNVIDDFVTNYLNLIKINEIEFPSLGYLYKLQKNHIETLGWDTIDLFIGRNIILKPELILEKFLREYRGGVCYELNGAFCYLLNKLGFDAYLASAYVHGYNDDIFNFKIDTHVVIILRLNEENYLVDVGWGDSYRHPILLQGQTKFSDISGEYILCSEQNTFKFDLKKFYNGLWRKQYSFSFTPSELISFYQNLNTVYKDPTHEVHRQLTCIKPSSKGYFALKNRELIIKTWNNSEIKSLDSYDEVQNTLINHFSINKSFVRSYFTEKNLINSWQ